MTDPLRHAMSLDQFEALCDLLREQNEWVPPARPTPAAPSGPHGPAGDDAPGSDFNARGSWAETGLFDAGWSWHRQYGDDRGHLTRPDKGRGVSASVGMVTSPDRGWPLFWCWSTSVGEFDPDTSYTRFGVLAVLKFGGDYSAAAKWLRSKGYGSDRPAQPDVIWREEPPAADDADVAGIDDLKRAGAEVKWVWPGWIQRGVVTAIAAQGGTGKTRETADLVRRVRHKQPWPDGADPIPFDGKTVALWVVADNHHDEMVTLCDAFGISDCVRLNAPKADPYAGVTLELAEDFVALERRVKAVRPLFVVVDTVGNATDKNLSRQEDAKAFYQPLQLIARRQNVAVLALTHLNAGGKVLGRRALEKVRTCIRMSAERINDTACKRRLEVIKSNSQYPAALGVTMGGSGNEYDFDPPPAPEDQSGFPGGSPDADPAKGPPTKVRACMEWLEAVLKDRPRLVHELRSEAESAGFSADTLYKAKTAMKLVEGREQSYKVWGLRKED